MSRLNFYFGYSLRSLKRDGTRTFLAGISVAFGVLSLVAMQLLANALLRGAMFDQRIQYGGDAQIHAQDMGQPFTAGDLEQIETWQQQGLIADYTLVSNGSPIYLRTATNGHVSILFNALGIDPATYPLVGELVLREPAGATAADVLKNPTDVLVTRDIADNREIHLGDTVTISGDSTPIQLTVAGIVGATPTQQGALVYYSLETARLVEKRDDVINMAAVNWGSAPNADQTIIDSAYTVFAAVDREGLVQSSSITAIFDVSLKGSGVLGLLIGGLSVSNTLQVILARRRMEIAMLKTVGYHRSDLLALISLETGIIGLAGGVAGAALGTVIARMLIDTLTGAGSISVLIAWQPDPVIVVGGVIAGILTAVVFGMQAILASSATRPVQLLRDLPLKTSQNTQVGRLALYALMLLLFGVLVGIVLGSPLEGILYVFGGGIVIVVLRAVFWTVLWVVLRVPLPRFPLLRLAKSNLRQRKTQGSLVLLALFAGTFSVTFAALAIYNAQSVVSRLRASDEGYNLLIYTTTDGVDEALTHMVAQGAQESYITERIRGTMNGERMMIEGRDAADLNKEISTSGDWSGDNAALLPEFYTSQYEEGDMLTVAVNGQEQTVMLVGFYTAGEASMTLQVSPLIVSRRVVESFDGDQLQARVIGKFPVSALNDAATTLGRALPNAMLLSRADLNEAGVAGFQALFMFAAAVAGLAFVAGAVLIANTAGLTVVERRREIGVFKAVGYTSGHVLRVMLSEYGFLGTLAGLGGIIGASVAIVALTFMSGAPLSLEPTILGGMLLFSVGIAVVSAALVTWQPTRVRPLDVLRYE